MSWNGPSSCWNGEKGNDVPLSGPEMNHGNRRIPGARGHLSRGQMKKRDIGLSATMDLTEVGDGDQLPKIPADLTSPHIGRKGPGPSQDAKGPPNGIIPRGVPR